MFDLHVNLNVTMVDTRRKRQILTYIWQNSSNSKGVIANPVRETRLNIALTVYLLIPRTIILRKYIFYYGVMLWNSLPNETHQCENIYEVKSKLLKKYKLM